MEPKTISQLRPGSSAGLWKTIIITGLIVGTLDALAAIVVSGAKPEGVFRFIASGAFGMKRAFSGSSIMVLWGILFHYTFAFSWSILYFLLFPIIPLLRKNKYITGMLYGIFIWLIMNRVVIPLSQIPQRPFNLSGALTGATILMLVVGLPIVLITHRYYWRKGDLSSGR